MIQETILALLTANRVVESCDGLDLNARGNDYQITRICVEDVNRIYHTRYRWPEDVQVRSTAEDIVLLYLTYYGMVYERDFGRVATKDVLVKIYHCGYRGFKRGDANGGRYARKIETATKCNRLKGKGAKCAR